MISTARMILRRPEPSDLAGMIEMESDPEVAKFCSFQVPQTIEQTTEKFNKHLKWQAELEPFGIWSMEERETGEFLGRVILLKMDGVHFELGYMIRKKCWGSGLTTEGCRGVLAYAMDQKIPTEFIRAVTNSDNLASQKVLEKLGFLKVDEKWEESTQLLIYRLELSSFSRV